MQEIIEKLRQENQRLKEENKLLRNELDKRGIIFFDPNTSLSSDDKMNIFMNYFRGRNDVYEKVYFSKKKQTFGWSIACDNAFGYGCKLGTKGNKCSTCSVSKFSTLTRTVIEDHFKGSNKNLGIGIYPLLLNNTCYFLALDFDDEHWFDDMYSVYQTALRFNLYPVMERSNSGSGGHLWFFFEEAISASKARRIGEFLLQETMKTNKNISFESFDRMFPNQDFLPEGGFGNQIALPLRASSYKKGNTAFINDLQQVIKNPMEYLSSRKKISLHEVDEILNNNQEQDYFFDGNQIRLCFDTDKIYTKELFGIENSMLAIEKKNLNANTYNTLKRMASMYNPKYYELQRLHKPIYFATTPRVLSFYEEDDKYLYLPRGIKDIIIDNLPQTKLSLDVQTSVGSPIDVAFKGELRDNQKNAVDKLIKHDMGILKAVPGFGKTVMGIYIISLFKVTTLVIVPTKTIQDQWEERINEFLDYPQAKLKKDRFICKYNGSQKILNGNIDIATAASLSNVENLEEVLSGYGLVLVDECHHAASNTFTHVLRHTRAKRIYGLSATPKRQDKLEKILYMFCGRIRYETSKHQIQNEYNFVQLLMPRMTNSRILKRDLNYTEICSELMKDTARNYLIVKDVIAEYEKTGKIIVLSERKEHLNILYEMIKYIGNNVYVLTGELKKKEREDILSKVKNIDSDDKYILLATSKLLGEGFDLPSLKTLFLVMPISDESRITQYTGRIHRNFEGKDVVKVYDYVDVHISMMQSMFHKRLKQYQKEGYRVEEQDQEVSVNKILFENDNYKPTIIEDFKNIKKEIVVFVTNLQLNRIKEYFKLLQDKHTQGKDIIFILTNKDKSKSDEINYLNGIGATIVYKDHNKRFIMIDRSIVWNADFDIFGKSKVDGYATRIVNDQFVNEILKELDEDELKSKSDELKLFY